jgi:hypothetical protein
LKEDVLMLSNAINRYANVLPVVNQSVGYLRKTGLFDIGQSLFDPAQLMQHFENKLNYLPAGLPVILSANFSPG